MRDPKYTVKKSLGQGAFGQVFLAIENESQQKCAIKRVMKVSKTVISREFQVLDTIKGIPHCIQLQNCFFTTENKALIQNLVFPYFEENLETCLRKHQLNKTTPDLLKTKLLCYQILKGLEKLKQQDIMHRDLKPENILKNEKDYIVIADFGSAKFASSDGISTPFMGSQYYRAPELFLGRTDYGCEVDIWSAGCIFLELMNLKPIFKGQKEEDQLMKMIELLGPISDKDFDQLVKLSQFSIHKLKKAQTLVDDYRHIMDEYYKQMGDYSLAKNFFSKMLKINPHKRWTATKLLDHEFFNDVRKQYLEAFDTSENET